ncbi:MAG: Uncharacterized protein Greene071421_297 [Parcubacteria group bacterium Greene0714_21]|nr:MAG: Uncharacterized protein Greene041639_571 [Parcubacteria group bacterium Greene0416_39]TSC97576.1 MAG: Uncharacterized protein Greene101447_430 [Parcubacteria group bacterium Greene1014_47]TSD04461.1 MAG: Uncharacterized protein Greene071421_297 [Parcubacteria group bacterium Greene0714_21]
MGDTGNVVYPKGYQRFESSRLRKKLMSWSFAIVNNKLAEIYFRHGKKSSRVYAHCYVRRGEYKTKVEQRWIKKDTEHLRFSYSKGKYKRISF